jgi:hypothetical protein
MKPWMVILVLVLLVAGAALAADEKADGETDVVWVGNGTCPVSGNPVGGTAASPFFNSDFKGYRIGFMCPSCKAKFEKADEAGKLELLNKALKTAGKPEVK